MLLKMASSDFSFPIETKMVDADIWDLARWFKAISVMVEDGWIFQFPLMCLLLPRVFD